MSLGWRRMKVGADMDLKVGKRKMIGMGKRGWGRQRRTRGTGYELDGWVKEFEGGGTRGTGYWLYNWLEGDGGERGTIGTVYGLDGWVEEERVRGWKDWRD